MTERRPVAPCISLRPMNPGAGLRGEDMQIFRNAELGIELLAYRGSGDVGMVREWHADEMPRRFFPTLDALFEARRHQQEQQQ